MAKDMPTGVKIISILHYLAAVVCLLAGLAIIAGSAILGSALTMLFKSTVLEAVFAAVGVSVGILMGILIIALAVLNFYVARGLWNGKSWARVTAIVLAALGAFNGLINLLLGGVIWLVVNAAIVWYLGFTKEGKAAFS